jgi:lytic cellulose monooxygenase (C1-hydroxylating)
VEKLVVADCHAIGTWAEDNLVVNNRSWTVTIPPTLKAGAYVLRHEIIALHSARSADGAQAYPQCINLLVSGGGSDTINGASPETFYHEDDPGILIDIYNNNAGTYQIPGPTVQTFGSGGSAPTTTGGAAPTTTVAPTTTPKPSTTLTTSTKPTTTTTTTTTSAPPAASCAAKYGQCGGQGWNG